MNEEQNFLIRAEDLEKVAELKFNHPLNPNSEIYLRNLSEKVGLQRLIVRFGRIPAGKESFIYHAHHHEEEFIYIISGRGIAEINDQEFEVASGDFLGFPVPGVAHHLRNPFAEDLVYLMGGERGDIEIGDYPRLHKRVIRDRHESYIIDLDAVQAFFPQQKDEPKSE